MPNFQLERDIWESVTVNGRYESDIFNDFLLRSPRRRIEQALQWICERGHLRKCGDRVRPLYARPERSYRYTNIRPVPGVEMLLAMHQNFTGESHERPTSHSSPERG